MNVRDLVVALCASLAAGCGGTALPPGGSPCVGSACPPPTQVCGDMQNDPNHCGSCGHRCGTQACNAGVCGPATSLIPVASQVSTAYARTMSGLAVDSTSVYWSERSSPTAVYRAPTGGGSAVLVASDPDPRALLLSGSTLFIGSGSGPATLREVATSGGAVTNLGSISSDFGWLAADASTVYWTTFSPYSIGSVSISGGTPATLGTPSTLAGSICADANNLYWVQAYSGVYTMPKTGGTPVELVADNGADQMILSGGYLYYSTNHGPSSSNNGLFRVPVTGGTPTKIASVFFLTAMATDGTTIYWTDGQTDLNIIRRAPAAGGSQFVSLTGYVTTARWSALDANYVYWNDGQSIYKTAR